MIEGFGSIREKYVIDNYTAREFSLTNSNMVGWDNQRL